MARNACYAAQQVLHDRDREARGIVRCPQTMTSKQEKESQGRGQTYWCKSGQDLWKLKTQQPHLFARHAALEAAATASAAAPKKSSQPQGFEASEHAGWLYNPERQIFLEESSQRMLWFDKATSIYREVAVGQDLSGCLSLCSGASAASTSAASTSAPSAGPQARHVVIMDLHKAAEALKLDLGHFDRPAAMLAVYGKGSAPELAARAMHEKLLKKLCEAKDRWSDESLERGIGEAFNAVVAEGETAAAVALVLGGRVVVATANGAACCLSELEEAAGTTRSITGANVAVLRMKDRGCHGLFLSTEGISDIVESALHVKKGRCRAGAVALLQRGGGAAACGRLLWSDKEKEAKKRRLENPPAKVRCRQILLKYVGCRHATDNVRKKAIRRPQAEAEALMLKVLAEVDAGGDAVFVRQCRAVSECSSSLKGGDLIGDVGWLARPVEKVGEKPSREAASRQAVVKAAFGLEVGEVSDLLVSDDGVHILQRRA